jgi:hypothetical protein
MQNCATLSTQTRYREAMAATPFTAPRRQPGRKAKPILLGKRGTPLEYAGCVHRTTTADDICLNCRKYVGEDKPVPPRRQPPQWKPPKIPQVPIPEQHYKIALQLYQRRCGITLAELAEAVELERHLVQNGLQYLEQNGLAVCHGRRRAARWAATARLRLVGPKSAASAADQLSQQASVRRNHSALSNPT